MLINFAIMKSMSIGGLSLDRGLHFRNNESTNCLEGQSEWLKQKYTISLWTLWYKCPGISSLVNVVNDWSCFLLNGLQTLPKGLEKRGSRDFSWLPQIYHRVRPKWDIIMLIRFFGTCFICSIPVINNSNCEGTVVVAFKDFWAVTTRWTKIT